VKPLPVWCSAPAVGGEDGGVLDVLADVLCGSACGGVVGAGHNGLLLIAAHATRAPKLDEPPVS
jgi:hypothetical protein